MTVYECNECSERHCVSENLQNERPTNCAFGMIACNWHKAEVIQKSSQLPKLTEDIFKHPEWPKEYICAAVNKDGTVSGFMHSPKVCGNWWVDSYSARPIPYPLDHLGKFDNSDWELSVVAVKLPAEKRLPNWCKIGGWVYYPRLNQFGKIVDFRDERKKVFIAYPGTNNPCSILYITEVKPARLRPWTFEDAPLMLKVIEKRTEREAVLSLCPDGYYRVGAFSSGRDHFHKIMQKYEQLDGQPCGVLEIAE